MSTAIILPASRDAVRAQLIVNRLVGANDCDLTMFVTSPGFDVENATNIRDEHVGSSRAIAHAMGHIGSRFERIGWLSDICIPQAHCIDNMIRFVDSHSNPFIAEFRTTPYANGLYRVCTITGRQYARWGMMNRKSIELCDGFFDEIYENYYGDVDLSLRCWKNGGAVATCVDAVIEMRGHSHPNTAPMSKDETEFLERWVCEYPIMSRDNTAIWNVDREIPL